MFANEQECLTILYHAPRDHGPSANRCFAAAQACREKSIYGGVSFVWDPKTNPTQPHPKNPGYGFS